MSDALKALIAKYRYYQMSDIELEKQAISFAYGNAHYEDDRVTREDVSRWSLLINGRRESGEGPPP